MKKYIHIIIGWGAFAFLIFCIVYSLFFDNNSPDIPHRQNNCSRIIYFNSTKKTFDTTYKNSVVYDDSLISFTNNNDSVLYQKDIAHEDDETSGVDDGESIDERDITIKNGHRYKVKLLDSCGCGDIQKIDSLKKVYND